MLIIWSNSGRIKKFGGISEAIKSGLESYINSIFCSYTFPAKYSINDNLWCNANDDKAPPSPISIHNWGDNKSNGFIFTAPKKNLQNIITQYKYCFK